MVRTTIILKKPQSLHEKGVLFTAAEPEWILLLRRANVAALARDYDIVISPTWSPPQDLPTLVALRQWPNQIFTLCSNFADIPAFRRMSAKLRPIPLLASSWVDPRLCMPDGGAPPEKEFDIAMLASFGSYKRHFAFFAALAKMRPQTRAVLMGRPWGGRTTETLAAEAGLFGVRDRITIRAQLSDFDMFHTLRSSKVSVITTLLEGSCVAVVESMFADVPVGLLAGARIGSAAYVNDQTGRFLRAERLSQDLDDFVDNHAHYRPREWAMSGGIDCWASSNILNWHLRQAAAERGSPWTQDIAPMHWRPKGQYLRQEDRDAILPEYESFESRYGVRLDIPRCEASEKRAGPVRQTAEPTPVAR